MHQVVSSLVAAILVLTITSALQPDAIRVAVDGMGADSACAVLSSDVRARLA